MEDVNCQKDRRSFQFFESRLMYLLHFVKSGRLAPNEWGSTLEEQERVIQGALDQVLESQELAVKRLTQFSSEVLSHHSMQYGPWKLLEEWGINGNDHKKIIDEALELVLEKEKKIMSVLQPAYKARFEFVCNTIFPDRNENCMHPQATRASYYDVVRGFDHSGLKDTIVKGEVSAGVPEIIVVEVRKSFPFNSNVHFEDWKDEHFQEGDFVDRQELVIGRVISRQVGRIEGDEITWKEVE